MAHLILEQNKEKPAKTIHQGDPEEETIFFLPLYILTGQSVPAPPPITLKPQANTMPFIRFKFNSSNQFSWYVGLMSHEEAQTQLQGQLHDMFLVCDSSTCPGDYVLFTSKNVWASYNIINSLPNHHFKIRDLEFDCLPALLEFYKTHCLNTITLMEPVPKYLGSLEYVWTPYDFLGIDAEDLPH